MVKSDLMRFRQRKCNCPHRRAMGPCRASTVGAEAPGALDAVLGDAAPGQPAAGQRREGFSLGNWAFCESWEMRKEPASLTVPTEYASVRKESGSWLNDSAIDHSGDSDR